VGPAEPAVFPSQGHQLLPLGYPCQSRDPLRGTFLGSMASQVRMGGLQFLQDSAPPVQCMLLPQGHFQMTIRSRGSKVWCALACGDSPQPISEDRVGGKWGGDPGT
jgi:hypothetical protein